MLCKGVVGQDLARQFFARAIEGGRLSHAYLFAGLEGVGKELFAQELAAALLCRNGPHSACGECVSCRMLVSGNHPAFTKLAPEAGKTLEIDTIRATIESLSLRGADRRVFILDQVDRLTIPAANAFLKTLEEPPSGIIFILITSRPAQLLDTIHSRCHRVPFQPLQREEFDQVVAGLDLPTQYERLYEASGGSPGIAVRLVEGIEQCGGPDRFEELIAGVGCDGLDAFGAYLPAGAKETKRDHARRVLRLVVDGVWGSRADEPDGRQDSAQRALELLEFLREIDGSLNPDLVLEDAARVLRG